MTVGELRKLIEGRKNEDEVPVEVEDASDASIEVEVSVERCHFSKDYFLQVHIMEDETADEDDEGYDDHDLGDDEDEVEDEGDEVDLEEENA
ncbi:MAG: hypothetical protein AB7G11_02350 [Phycisphaerales bacterium]